MSLPQLIGLKCVACQKEIASVVEGAFCDDCGNPVHRKCARFAAEAIDENCPTCGGDPDSDIAIEVSTVRDAEAAAEEQRKEAALTPVRVAYPISETCPQCASATFMSRRPGTWIAFQHDRICTACGTRYSPPTPHWAAVTFIAAGVILAGFAVVSIVGSLLIDNPLVLPVAACEGFLGVIGILAIIHGMHNLTPSVKP